jgi:hypothetical protein
LADLAPSQQVWLGKVILGGALLALSTPVELAVPLIRALSRQRGVQTGVAIGSLASFLLAQAHFTAATHRPPPATWMDRVILSAAMVLPAAGAVFPGTVVLPKRSPLWGWALWLVVRLLASTVLAEEASRLKKRREAEAASAPDEP